MGYFNNTNTATSSRGLKFLPATVVATPAAVEAISHEKASKLLARHVMGDWGDVDEHDRKVNEEALTSKERLMSVYKSDKHPTIWIITDRGWEITTILTPNDY